MSDTEITCQDCKTTFLFTEQDQDFYAEKGFTPPKRCKPCRQVRKANKESGVGASIGGERRSSSRGSGGHQDRELHDAVCSSCGDSTQVPFKPAGDRPVLCKPCFAEKKGGRR